jgi:hypothetical protein
MDDGLCRRVCAWLADPPPAGAPPADVLTAARSEGVHLILADRCAAAGLDADLRAAAILDAIQTRELGAVLAALAGAGIEPVLLKGAALACTHYPRPELRPRSDTDLMIPGGAREGAARALRDLGYARADELDGELAIGQFHFTRIDRHGVPHVLDVHWRVSNVRIFADAVSYDELRRDAVPLAALGPAAWSPSPVHALLLACIHRVAHHGDTRNLLWLLDVHLLAGGLSAREGEAFVDLAANRRMQAVCAWTLELSQAAFGRLDAAWVGALSAGGDPDEPSRAFIGGGHRLAGILVADVAATPGWTARLRLLREHVLPGLTYMRARYPRCPALLLPAAYVHRVLFGLPRWLRREAPGGTDG